MAYPLDYKADILALALDEFTPRATIARGAYRDMSQVFNLAQQGDTARITVVQNPGEPEEAQMRVTPSAIRRPSTYKLDMLLDMWRWYYWDVSDSELQDYGNRNTYERIVRKYAGSLASWTEQQIFRAVAGGAGRATGEVGTALTGDSWADAFRALFERNADGDSMVAYVSGVVMNELMKDDDFNRVDSRGADAQATGRDAILGTKYGFNFAPSNNLPNITRSAATGSTNGAHAAGALNVAVDTLGAGGIDRGELLTIGGTTYACDTTLNAAAGTITLDRPLAAAVADNVAINRHAAHRPNFAMNPQAVAVAFRPTAPAVGPSSGGRYDAVSLSDPETGISLTLKPHALEGGTRFYLSVLFGAKVISPDEVQRVLR